jgi:hypothetical protein
MVITDLRLCLCEELSAELDAHWCDVHPHPKLLENQRTRRQGIVLSNRDERTKILLSEIANRQVVVVGQREEYYSFRIRVLEI